MQAEEEKQPIENNQKNDDTEEEGLFELDEEGDAQFKDANGDQPEGMVDTD